MLGKFREFDLIANYRRSPITVKITYISVLYLIKTYYHNSWFTQTRQRICWIWVDGKHYCDPRAICVVQLYWLLAHSVHESINQIQDSRLLNRTLSPKKKSLVEWLFSKILDRESHVNLFTFWRRCFTPTQWFFDENLIHLLCLEIPTFHIRIWKWNQPFWSAWAN